MDPGPPGSASGSPSRAAGRYSWKPALQVVPEHLPLFASGGDRMPAERSPGSMIRRHRRSLNHPGPTAIARVGAGGGRGRHDRAPSQHSHVRSRLRPRSVHTPDSGSRAGRASSRGSRTAVETVSARFAWAEIIGLSGHEGCKQKVLFWLTAYFSRTAGLRDADHRGCDAHLPPRLRSRESSPSSDRTNVGFFCEEPATGITCSASASGQITDTW